MSDSVEAPDATEGVEDTPVEESTPTPTEGHGAEETNWEKRYSDLQPAYTKASQEAAELRSWKESLLSDPDTQRQLLEELGYELGDDESIEPAEEPDPITALHKDVETLKMAKLEMEQAAQVKWVEENVEQRLKAIGDQRGTPLSDIERKFVIATAVSSFPAGDDGLPQIDAAWKDYQVALDEQKKQWIESKHAPTPPSGVAVSDMPDLDNEQDRINHMVARLQAKRDV
jgi:hypothetical protein